MTALREVERADLGLDLEVDQVAAEHGRREAQTHAELFEGDGHRVRARAGLHDRVGILAAGEEAGFLAVGGDEVRFRQALEEALVREPALPVRST